MQSHLNSKNIFLIPAEFAYELAAKFGMNIIYIGTSSCVISTIQEELKVIFSPSFKANKESVITLNKNIKDAVTQAKMNNLNKESEITESTKSTSSPNDPSPPINTSMSNVEEPNPPPVTKQAQQDTGQDTSTTVTTLS